MVRVGGRGWGGVGGGGRERGVGGLGDVCTCFFGCEDMCMYVHASVYEYDMCMYARFYHIYSR